MAQLVGRSCVHCRERIGSDLDGRFCASCGCPVHTPCAAAAAKDGGACPACGAPAAEVAARRAAEPPPAAPAGNVQRTRGALVAAVSAGMVLLGLMQFALADSRPPAADRHEARGNTGNALIPIGIGLVGIALGVRQMVKNS